MISSNKFASVLSSTVVIVLIIVVVWLMFQVRTLYHDHLKLRRLLEYKAELEFIHNHFDRVHEDIQQVGEEFEVYKKGWQ